MRSDRADARSTVAVDEELPSTPIPARFHRDPTPRQVRLARRASFWRAKFWGLLLSLFTDGVTTDNGTALVPLSAKPTLPDGPLIVVANHASHLDSIALAATIGRTRPVRFVAAADYWVASKFLMWGSALFVGIWPVRRRREGRADLFAAEGSITAGVVLVVFPEGTRRRGHVMNHFKRGAFELASRTGAQVLPIGIVGAGESLPPDRIWPRRRPINIRWGTPFTVSSQEPAETSATRAFEIVKDLAKAPAVAQPGAGWSRVHRIAFSVTGLAIISGWSFAEGIFWPLVAEMPLLLFVVTVGRSWRGPLLIATTALASVAGVFTTWWLVSQGIDTPTPLTTERMHVEALRQLVTEPATAFWNQMGNGIPVKVYAHASGTLGLSFTEMISIVFPRAFRIVVVGTIAWLIGGMLARFLKPCLGFVQVTCLALFPVFLAVVIGYWS